MGQRTQKILATIAAIACLAGSFSLSQRLNGMRESFQLVQASLPTQARADLLTSVLLSVGRALAVDYLWIGLQKMQEEGRYFDANQRAEWICQLQPRFPAVWIFQAWNMAYNISVAMNTGEDRWRWVRNGYELVRDRGLVYNPKEIKLYQQIAWIFHHKIGALSDDYHLYYKMQIARSIEPIVGWPNEKYDIMAAAPTTWEALAAEPGMKEFLATLAEYKVDVQGEYLKLLAKPSDYSDKLVAIVNDPKNKKQSDLLEGYLRAQWLMNEWKIDAALFGEVRKNYGPLDLRTPQAHAIYWAYAGVKATGGDTSFDALSNDRVIYGSLQDLAHRGRITLPPSEDMLPLVAPDLRFIPVVDQTYVAMGKKWATAEGIKWDGTATEKFQSGHVNFLRKAISFFYQYGDLKTAAKYWDRMISMYPLPEYKIGMEAYVKKMIMEDVGSLAVDDARKMVIAFLVQSMGQYAMGDDYTAMATENTAKIIYDSYNENGMRAMREQTGRVTLPPWKDMKKMALDQAMEFFPPPLKERLRDRLGLTSQPDAATKGSPAEASGSSNTNKEAPPLLQRRD